MWRLKQVIIKTCCDNEPALRSMIQIRYQSWGDSGAVLKASNKNSNKAVTTTLKAVTVVATPIGVVADIAQAGLAVAGHKKVGKVVGASGNVTSGAAIDIVVGGPVGAGLGAVAGVWFAGEVVGDVFDCYIAVFT